MVYGVVDGRCGPWTVWSTDNVVPQLCGSVMVLSVDGLVHGCGLRMLWSLDSVAKYGHSNT